MIEYNICMKNDKNILKITHFHLEKYIIMI